MLDKEAILKRFKSNVVDRKNWKEAAIKAAESCLEMGPKIAEDSDCKSGSAELFACVFKEVFFVSNLRHPI